MCILGGLWESMMLEKKRVAVQVDVGRRTHEPVLVCRAVAGIAVVARLCTREALAHSLAGASATIFIVGSIEAREVVRDCEVGAVAGFVAR